LIEIVFLDVVIIVHSRYQKVKPLALVQ